MMRKGELKTGRVGVVYLKVTEPGCPYDGHVYPCAGMRYTMEINAIPSAAVYVPIGSFLGGKEEQGRKYETPQRLLEWVQSHNATSTVNLFVGCQIYEERHDSKEDTLIFSGYIVAGGVVYTSTGKSGLQVQFNCLGKAAKLVIRPVSGYIDVASASLINALRLKENATMQAATDSGVRLAQTNIVAPRLAAQLRGTSISERVATCIGALRTQLTYDQTKNDAVPIPQDSDTAAALGGNVYLKTNGLAGTDPACDAGYTQAMYRMLMHGAESMDIWSAMVRVLTSSEFSLQLVPRWSCDTEHDFKMDICPVTTWKAGYDVLLDGPMIEKFTMQENIMDRINEPEVVFGDFSQLYELVNRDGGGQGVMGIYGVYAKDKKLNAVLQSKSMAQDVLAMQYDCRNYRVAALPTPTWLTIAACSYQSNLVNYMGQDNRRDPAVIKQKASADVSAVDAAAAAQPVPNRGQNATATAFDLANRLAELMFVHNYMAYDMAQVVVTPDARFGGRGVVFENMLGKTVQVDLSGTVAGTEMKIRGALRSVTYNYSAAESSGVSYQMMLDRVRLADADMPVIDNYPIYKV